MNVMRNRVGKRRAVLWGGVSAVAVAALAAGGVALTNSALTNSALTSGTGGGRAHQVTAQSVSNAHSANRAQSSNRAQFSNRPQSLSRAQSISEAQSVAPASSAPVSSAPSSAAPVSSTASPAAGLPVLTIGGFTGREPAEIDFSADGGNIVTGIRWTSWTATGASGNGRSGIEGCVPNCAMGSVRYVPTTITLSGPAEGRFTSLAEHRAGRVFTMKWPRPWPLEAEPR